MLEFSSRNIMEFTFILWTMNFILQENLHTTISMKMWKSLHIFPGQYLLVCRILILPRILSIAMTGRQDLFQCFCIRYLEMIIFMRESKPCLRFITCSFRDAGEFRRLWILQDSRHTFSMHMNWNLMAKQTT